MRENANGREMGEVPLLLISPFPALYPNPQPHSPLTSPSPTSPPPLLFPFSLPTPLPSPTFPPSIPLPASPLPFPSHSTFSLPFPFPFFLLPSSFPQPPTPPISARGSPASELAGRARMTACKKPGSLSPRRPCLLRWRRGRHGRDLRGRECGRG